MDSSSNDPGEGRINEFIDRQKELLDMEKVAKAKRNIHELRELGDTLNVEFVKTRVPKFGGTDVSFRPLISKTATKCPIFKKGNLVGVDTGDGSDMLNGILVSVRQTAFEVHVKDSESIFKVMKTYELVKISDEGVYEQYALALDGIRNNKTKLRKVLFGLSQPSPPLNKFYEMNDNLNVMNTDLDPSQREAVEFAVKQKELAVIHGPPGTGKTTTLVEIMRQVSLDITH
jgi:ATP-dependent RNA/DNA helicase IGHMBP2